MHYRPTVSCRLTQRGRAANMEGTDPLRKTEEARKPAPPPPPIPSLYYKTAPLNPIQLSASS